MIADGTQRWQRDSQNALAWHAADLFDIAQASFVDGCTRQQLPELEAENDQRLALLLETLDELPTKPWH